jgi:hypothetical protein
VLSAEDDLLPARSAALARFAVTLTARPWALTPDLGIDLTAEELESAVGVVAMFNYLTRVADASGIEFDYVSPLPAFRPEREREPAARPQPRTWPMVPAEFRMFPSFPVMSEAWRELREYVFDSDEPLTRRERLVLASVAARESCDRWRVEELGDCSPGDARESVLAAFAGKLSREPWRMRPADLQELRDAGFAEPALLHAISVVALQNAESRLAMGRALTVR